MCQAWRRPLLIRKPELLCLAHLDTVNMLPTLSLQAEGDTQGQAHPPHHPGPPDLRVWGTFNGAGDLGILSLQKRYCPDLVHKPWWDCGDHGRRERETKRGRDKENERHKNKGAGGEVIDVKIDRDRER